MLDTKNFLLQLTYGRCPQLVEISVNSFDAPCVSYTLVMSQRVRYDRSTLVCADEFCVPSRSTVRAAAATGIIIDHGTMVVMSWHDEVEDLHVLSALSGLRLIKR